MAKSKGKKKEEGSGQEVLDKEQTDVSEKGAEDQAETKEVDEKSEVDQLKEEIDEQKDKYLRLYSEFDNFRKRTAKEKLDLIKTANEGLVLSLLPVLDDFERAQKAAEENNDKATIEGIELIYQKLVKILEQKGVKEMETAKGDDFDDEVHEAITQIPAPEKKLKGKIVDVIEPGYYLNEKVIRFAKVVTGA